MKNLLLTMIVGLCLLASQTSRAAEQGAPKQQFDFLIGEWQCQYLAYAQEKITSRYPCQWSARYTFDGNMVQDDFRLFKDQQVIFAGTTLRTWAAQKNRWDLAFLGINVGHFPNFYGQWQNDHMRITVTGEDEQGQYETLIRFRDISSDSFIWDMQRSRDGGKNWTLEVEIHASRAPGDSSN